MSSDVLRAPRDLDRFLKAAPSPASWDRFDFVGCDDVFEGSSVAVIATSCDTASALAQGLRSALSLAPGR